VWKALCAALLPIRFEHIRETLAEVIEYLMRHDPHRNRQRATERCLRRWGDDPGGTAEGMA
jgi:hypothetical protein